MTFLDRILSVLGCLTLVAMIFSIGFNVLGRFFLNHSIKWAEEFGYMFFSWLVFLGAAVCYKNDELISINVFVLMLPKGVRQVLFVLKRIFMLAANIWLLKISIDFTKAGAAKLTSLMRIPYTYLDLPIAIMFAACTVYAIMHAYLAVTGKAVADTERHAE